MIKNFDLFNFLEFSEEEIKKIVDEQDDGFDDYQYDNAMSALLELQQYLSGKNELNLFRLLQIDDIENIDKNNLGNHYTTDIEFMDDATLYDIGININKTIYKIEIQTDISNIDLDKTIETNVFYPFEHEIYIKKRHIINNREY